MKKLFVIVSLAALCALPAKAQLFGTNAVPVSSGGVIGDVLGYFTSFNTNLDDCFGAKDFTVWTGASSIQGGVNPLVNDIGLSYDLWRPTPAAGSATSTAISLESITRNSGVAGLLVSEQGGAGFSIILHDVRATAFLHGGYAFAGSASKSDRFFGEAGVRVFKALGHNFFAGVGLAARFPSSAQVLSAEGGVTF